MPDTGATPLVSTSPGPIGLVISEYGTRRQANSAPRGGPLPAAQLARRDRRGGAFSSSSEPRLVRLDPALAALDVLVPDLPAALVLPPVLFRPAVAFPSADAFVAVVLAPPDFAPLDLPAPALALAPASL